MVNGIIPIDPTDEQLQSLQERLIARLEHEKLFIFASFDVFRRLREVEPDKYSQALRRWRWAIDNMR